jgi:hypothetical protein
LSGVSGILMSTKTQGMKLLYRGANDNADRELSSLDWSLLSLWWPAVREAETQIGFDWVYNRHGRDARSKTEDRGINPR